MWRHARLFISPVRSTSTSRTLPITRYLRTQCINLHPRGFTRHDVAETSSHARILEEDHHTETHKDTRTIDHMDPVVLKYTNIINELRSKSSGVERVNETHFGSIRFDNENLPHLHGQFDGEYGPVTTTRGKERAAKYHLKLDSTEGRAGVVKIAEEDKIENGHNEAMEARLHPPTEELMTGGGGESKDVSVMESAAHESNYIDECVFGSAVSSPTANSVKPPVESLGGSINSEHTNYKIDDSNVRNLNYVDEVFFKNSLENLEINRQPAIDYSEIKKDLEETLLYGEKHHTEGSKIDEGKVVDKEARLVEPDSMKNEDDLSRNKTKEQLSTTETTETPKSAFDYIVKKRQEEHKKQHGLNQTPGDGSNKSYKKVLSLISEKSKDKFTRHDVLKTLKSSILYNDHDIVGLYKPYGIVMHGGGDSRYHVLTDYLPDLATFLKAEALYPVHRLDATTTGVVLLARTPAMADILKSMFKERQLKKKYWAIIKGTPKHMQGIIDIPIAEGMVDGRRRMVLKPDVKSLKSTSTKSQIAVTKFKVISTRNSATLVELSPLTGVKHQLRVHMAFGLSCPILGDHKYSHLKKLAPQALPGDVLDCLRIKQSKVRQLPLYLHCKSILVPEILEGRNVFIQARLPAYFNKTVSLLKLNRHGSKVKLEEPFTSPP